MEKIGSGVRINPADLIERMKASVENIAASIPEASALMCIVFSQPPGLADTGDGRRVLTDVYAIGSFEEAIIAANLFLEVAASISEQNGDTGRSEMLRRFSSIIEAAIGAKSSIIMSSGGDDEPRH